MEEKHYWTKLKVMRYSRRQLLRQAILGGATAASLGLIGCGSGGTKSSSSSSSASTAATQEAGQPWDALAVGASPQVKQQWDALVDAARKEGTLVISGSPTPDTRKNLPAAFKDRFGIDMQYLAGASSDLAARLQSERAAGQYTIDASISGAQTMYTTFYKNGWLQPYKPLLILPQVTDDKYWTSGKLWFMDPNGDTVFRLLNYSAHPLTINTKLLPPSQIKSADQLLDPKFKGKIGAYDPTTNGSGLPTAAEYYIQKGEDYWVKLYKGQQVQISRDTQQLVDDLSRGKYMALIGVGWAYIDPAAKQGLPVADVPLSDIPDYISAGFGTVAVYDHPPHPNAAKVFANWIASKEGATVDSKAEVAVSNRNDIDYSWAPDEARPKPNVKYFDSYGWDFTVNQLVPLRDKMATLLKS